MRPLTPRERATLVVRHIEATDRHAERLDSVMSQVDEIEHAIKEAVRVETERQRAFIERVAEGLPELRIASVSWCWADEHNAKLDALATEARRLLGRA